MTVSFELHRLYLAPISGSMHVSIEGVYGTTEKIEDRSRIGETTLQNHVENAVRTYLDRIRNRMQKPIEGLLTSVDLCKREEVCHESNRRHTLSGNLSSRKVPPATSRNRKDPIYESRQPSSKIRLRHRNI